MPKHTRNHANHTGRSLRRVLAVAGCQAAARSYFGYWFSH